MMPVTMPWDKGTPAGPPEDGVGTGEETEKRKDCKLPQQERQLHHLEPDTNSLSPGMRKAERLEEKANELRSSTVFHPAPNGA